MSINQILPPWSRCSGAIPKAFRNCQLYFGIKNCEMNISTLSEWPFEKHIYTTEFHFPTHFQQYNMKFIFGKPYACHFNYFQIDLPGWYFTLPEKGKPFLTSHTYSRSYFSEVYFQISISGDLTFNVLSNTHLQQSFPENPHEHSKPVTRKETTFT